MSASRRSPLPAHRALLLLGAAILLGGLRDPRLFAAGGLAIWALVWAERPALGPAAAWLPWLAWAGVSAASSSQPLAALPFLARWSACLAFASLASSWEARERENWLKTLLIVSAILAAAALWAGAPRGFLSEMIGLIPPYYNYTAFALAAAAAGGAAWALHPNVRSRRARSVALAAAALAAACLILARSRGAGLGLVFAGGVWAARRWGGKAALAAAIALGLAVGAFQARLLPDSWSFVLLKLGQRSQEARPEIWSRAAAMADEKPWLGEGPGSFGAGFRRRPVESSGGQARWGMNTDYAHSEPLQAAGETGWLGLALWLMGMGSALSVLFAPADQEPAREAAVAAAAAMAAQLTVDNMLQIPGLALLFFSALAVADARPPGGRRWTRAAIVAGGLLALAAWIPRALADGNPVRAAALFPAESEPREDLAYRAMASGRPAEADAFWAEAEKRAPFDAVYPWRRAQLAGASGHWDAALALADRALVDEPTFLNDRVLRAEALVHLGRNSDARDELGSVLRGLDERGGRLGGSGYDKTIWDFDRTEYDRVAALAALPKKR